jgi:hypothetical protein
MAAAWTFRDAAGLATAARWLLYADAAICTAAAALSLGLGADELIYGDLARPLALAQLATALGSLVAFLIWLYRANANARALGATDLMGSPGLAVAWFFIPIAFLFMPYLTVRDTMRASAEPRDWQGQSAPALAGLWWACYLAATIFGAISFRVVVEEQYDMIQVIGGLDLASNLLSVPAALLGAAIVGRVRQQQSAFSRLADRFA